MAGWTGCFGGGGGPGFRASLGPRFAIVIAIVFVAVRRRLSHVPLSRHPHSPHSLRSRLCSSRYLFPALCVLYTVLMIGTGPVNYLVSSEAFPTGVRATVRGGGGLGGQHEHYQPSSTHAPTPTLTPAPAPTHTPARPHARAHARAHAHAHARAHADSHAHTRPRTHSHVPPPLAVLRYDCCLVQSRGDHRHHLVRLVSQKIWRRGCYGACVRWQPPARCSSPPSLAPLSHTPHPHHSVLVRGVDVDHFCVDRGVLSRRCRQ